MSLDTNSEDAEQIIEETTLADTASESTIEEIDILDNDSTTDSTQTSEETTLDEYVTTGIYTEEGNPAGDMLLVLGKDILETHVRQFYLAASNAVFARIETEEWTSWYAIKSDKPTEQENLDLNTLLETNLFDLTGVEKFENHPEGFSSSENSLLFCVPVTEDHCLQFLVADSRSSFWVRHYTDTTWDIWNRFV
ncbi:hypothetical protein [Candidatus Clavichlamydia salmonicola]|uniref:hypothetical protein n=1 Tax=Candidatus Clavichlamydia salmonicola TaxID=469812 RepID=UPI00189135CF|nr:hypothetical protein [Candidatus Clavichlamydia salmonicola]